MILLSIPILFDSFHHECLNSGDEPVISALRKAMSTWKKDRDGIPMVDYSSQSVIDIDYYGMVKSKTKRGKHTTTIDQNLFQRFLKETIGLDFDLMLEIKDREECVSSIRTSKKTRRIRLLMLRPRSKSVLSNF